MMQVNEHDADRERENDANHTAGARTEGSGMRADMGDIAGNRTADGHRGANADEHARFVHLKDSNDLKVADGEPDIRGWDLQTTDGMTIGKVVDLIVDTSLMKVRYIEGKLEHDDGSARDERIVLFPLMTSRLDEGADKVIVDYSMLQATAMPSYDRDALSTSAIDGGALDDANFFGTRRQGRESSSYIAPRQDRDADADFRAL